MTSPLRVLIVNAVNVTWFATVHTGVVPEREGQVASEPDEAGERTASSGSWQYERQHRRGTPLGGLSIRDPGGQQQPAASG